MREVKRAAAADVHAIAEMAMKMWKGHTREELTEEFLALIESEDAAVFLGAETGKYTGFAQCQLRHDYVEGTDTSPVGYLEGIFVEAEYRRQGWAKRLLEACEAWSREKGCVEFASDCEIDNADSLAFHMKMGFIEAGRIICFQKTL